jgi:hypothetical protein
MIVLYRLYQDKLSIGPGQEIQDQAFEKYVTQLDISLLVDNISIIF